jgi:hypothetical protein
MVEPRDRGLNLVPGNPVSFLRQTSMVSSQTRTLISRVAGTTVRSAPKGREPAFDGRARMGEIGTNYLYTTSLTSRLWAPLHAAAATAIQSRLSRSNLIVG